MSAYGRESKKWAMTQRTRHVGVWGFGQRLAVRGLGGGQGG